MNRNPKELPPKSPDTKCNARTPNGYCRNKAGFKTAHVGSGRCWLHGGSTVSLTVQQKEAITSVYSKMLPTNLAIELTEMKSSPTFSTLIEEFTLLRLVVQGLLTDLPADFSAIYGRPVCENCKDELDIKDSDVDNYLLVPFDFRQQQKRLDKLVSTVETMSRVFEKISKHEERQKRFVQISELEAIVMRWGKIMMKHLGNDPIVDVIKDEIMSAGFMRKPGDQDKDRMKKVEFLRKKMRSKIHNGVKSGNKMSVLDALKEVDSEYVEFEETGRVKKKKKRRKRKVMSNIEKANKDKLLKKRKENESNGKKTSKKFPRKDPNIKRKKVKHDGKYIEY